MFPNKKTSDNQPDFKGKILLKSGDEIELAGWNKTSKNGLNYISLMQSEPFVRMKTAVEVQPIIKGVQSQSDVENDNLPF